MRRLTALLAALAASWALSGSALAADPKASGKVTGAQCADCHKAEVKSHGNHAYHGDCGSCHVSAADHAKAEEAKEKAGKGPKPKSVHAGLPETKECLSCHQGDARRMNFAFAEHDKAGVQCRDCHGNHTPKVKSLNAGMERGGKEVALCATCHKDVLAKFSMRSHHPVKEGGLTCSNCHDPHGGKQLTLAGKTSQCTQCHQAERGPHAFDHAPVVEDCTNCHNPHGSPNRRMLNLAMPMLCLQCHSVAGNRHGATGANSNGQVISATALRNCQSCHSAPHGSHMDQHLRF